MQHELVDTPFEARDGVVHATLTKPGLGIEVNEAVVRKYEL
jgi:L-alanine-DL-glutamate epimerase-like enolase superfamily enzyme